MPITNITATASNGTFVVSTPNTIAAGVTATATEECLVLTANNALACSNNAGAVVEVTDCLIKMGDIESGLSYGNNTDSLSRVNLTRVSILWSLAAARRSIRVSRLNDVRLLCTDTGGQSFVYTQPGAVLDKVVFRGMFVHEIAGAPSVFRDVEYVDCGINLLNWQAGGLSLSGVVLGSGTRVVNSYVGADGATYNTYDAWVGSGNGGNRLYFTNSTVNLAKLAIQLSAAAGTEIATKAFTRSERYVVGISAAIGARVGFTPTASSGSSSQQGFTMQVGPSGALQSGGVDILEVSLLTQATVDTGGAAYSTGVPEPPSARPYALRDVSWQRVVRRADLLSSVSDVTPSAEVGSASAPATVELSLDTQFTGTVAAADAITGVAFTVASGEVLVDITQDRTGQEVYNRWKSWTSEFAQLTVDQALIRISNGRLVVTGDMVTSAVVSAGGNVSLIQATGSALATGAGSYTLPILDENGDSFVEEANGASLKVYASSANRDARTSALVVDVARFRFTYATRPANTLYLWVRVGSAEYPAEINLVSGANTLDLGVSGQLLQLGVKIDGVPSLVWAEPNRHLSKEDWATLSAIEGSSVVAKEDTVSSRASQSSVDSLATSVSGKASQSSVDSLATSVSGKASQSSVDSLATSVSGKASQSSVDSLATSVSGKASQSSVASLATGQTAIGLAVGDIQDNALRASDSRLDNLVDLGPALEVINEGVKLASLSIPHEGDLP